MSNRFDLVARKAVGRRLQSAAQQRPWIEVAASRIIQNTVHYAVKSVACRVDRSTEKCVLRGEDCARGIMKHLPHYPQIAAYMMMRVVGDWITRTTPVKAIGK